MISEDLRLIQQDVALLRQLWPSPPDRAQALLEDLQWRLQALIAATGGRGGEDGR